MKTLTRNWRDHCRTGTRKLYRDISTGTAIFISQKRVNVYEYTTKMVSCDMWSHANDPFSEPAVLKASLNGVLCLPKIICVTDMLKIIPVEDFQRCYQKWAQRLHQCVAAQGNYFEGDTIDVCKQIKTLVNKKSVSLLFCHTSYSLPSDCVKCFSGNVEYGKQPCDICT